MTDEGKWLIVSLMKKHGNPIALATQVPCDVRTVKKWWKVYQKPFFLGWVLVNIRSEKIVPWGHFKIRKLGSFDLTQGIKMRILLLCMKKKSVLCEKFS